MAIDLSNVVTSPDLDAQPFTINRTTGAFAQGGWQANAPTAIPAFGVISTATAKDLDMVPEGDRVRESLVFYNVQQIFVTNAQNSQISDVLVWKGVQYRVYFVADYSTYGFWKAIACRKLGD